MGGIALSLGAALLTHGISTAFATTKVGMAVFKGVSAAKAGTSLGAAVFVAGSMGAIALGASDFLSNRVSSREEYLRRALAGSISGLLSGATTLALADAGLLAVMGGSFAEGFVSDAIAQKILNEDGSINWGQCVGSGAFSSIIDGVMCARILADGSRVKFKETFNNWEDMKNAYKGRVTKFVNDNKPLGATHPRNWLKKEGTSLTIETLYNGAQVWKYTQNGITVPYVPRMIKGELQLVIKFPKKYLYWDSDIAQFMVEGGFTGNRELDRRLVLEYLKSEGYTAVPRNYIIHHDIEDGVFQIVRGDIHTMFHHYGGHFFNQ